MDGRSKETLFPPNADDLSEASPVCCACCALFNTGTALCLSRTTSASSEALIAAIKARLHLHFYHQLRTLTNLFVFSFFFWIRFTLWIEGDMNTLAHTDAHLHECESEEVRGSQAVSQNCLYLYPTYARFIRKWIRWSSPSYVTTHPCHGALVTTLRH